MLVSMEWLAELVDVGVSVDELVQRLDMSGTAVEAIHVHGESLEGVVIGRVLTKTRHPNADRLWYCSVDVGGEDALAIVCGAQNFDVNDVVPVAMVGAMLPNGMIIKRAEIRGVASEGMMCSPIELGLGDDSSGLLILPADAPVGMSFASYQGLGDTILELEITPNRPDCLSVSGVAREVGAILGAESRVPASKPSESGQAIDELVEVRIDDAALCPRYSARLVTGVRVGPSPQWLARRVTAAGARPINNVVDVTNYVMFELGQPLHAFDARTLSSDDGGTCVIVRRAAEGERLVTLDGQERRLDSSTLVIADPSGAIALAGVMGGEATEVSESTVDVLLESACFQPASIGRTSRSLGLVSEASLRFERGVDPNGCVAALDRAAALLAEVSGGAVFAGVADAYPTPVSPRSLSVRVSRVNAVLGTCLVGADVAGILGRLGLGTCGEGETIEVTVPTWRPDLEREIDLIEELVRVWGMERVPSTLPEGRGRLGSVTERQKLVSRIHLAMRSSGLNETMTYSFGDPSDLDKLGMGLDPGEVLVEVSNPMSAEQSVLRRSLAPGLLRSVSHNQRRGVPDVHLYEVGTVFVSGPGRKQPKELQAVAGALGGSWHERAWNDPPESPVSPAGLDFFDGKGVLETLMEELGISDWRLVSREHGWLQPGRSGDIVIGGDVVGWLGNAHPRVEESFEVGGPTVLFELSVERLFAATPSLKRYSDIPRYPAVRLDVALVVREGVEAAQVEEAFATSRTPFLESFRLFDVYTGEGLPKGTRSLAFAITYRHSDRTLTDEEVVPVHHDLVQAVCAAVGAEVRE